MDIITACNASDLNKKEWMKIHNVSPKSFYRWQKILRDRALSEMEDYSYPILPSYAEGTSNSTVQEPAPGFVDMTAVMSQGVKERIPAVAETEPQQNSMKTELMIQVGSYNLYIGNGITESTLATVLKVIGNA